MWARYINKHVSSRSTSGFTIVELLIVIVVIGILAAITLVAFGGVRDRARDAERSSHVASLQKAIEIYKVDHGEYPLHTDGVNNSGYSISVLQSLLVPKYLPALPVDPRGTGSTNYQYVRGTHGGGSYAIRVQYEAKTQCKVGKNHESSGWWGIANC